MFLPDSVAHRLWVHENVDMFLATSASSARRSPVRHLGSRSPTPSADRLLSGGPTGCSPDELAALLIRLALPTDTDERVRSRCLANGRR